VDQIEGPLPEVFGFKEEGPFCILGEEAGENDTIEGLTRRLAANPPISPKSRFCPVPGYKTPQRLR